METLLTTAAAAERLAVKSSTLARWRRQGRGPRFLKLGRKTLRYRLGDVDKWAARHLTARSA